MKSNDSTLVVLLDTLSQLGGEAGLLVEIYSLIGREATLKLMEYFKGTKVSFPSEHFIDEKLIHIQGYIKYIINGEPWDKVIKDLYGDNPSRADIRKFGVSIRSLKKRLPQLAVEPMMVTQKATELIRSDMKYIKEEILDADSNI